MDKNYSLRDDGSFLIKDYNHTRSFSNFLPGVAGAWGIPLWVFYVNRVQGIISFGLQDKNHAITEFFPANKAYWLVSSCGFRTFLKINPSASFRIDPEHGRRVDNEICYEPFQPDAVSKLEKACARPMPGKRGRIEQQMIIKSASLELREINPHLGLNFSVKYFTLPNHPAGGLVRILTKKNESSQRLNLDILDGLPRIIPFGAKYAFLKDLSRTLEAWMRSFIFSRHAIFRLIVDPSDVSRTEYIRGATFNYAMYEERGKIISPYFIVDPDAIFAEDKSYNTALKFFHKDFKVPLNQVLCTKTPCAFSHFKWSLSPGQSRVFYSIFGSSFTLDSIKKNVCCLKPKDLGEKEKENEALIKEIKNNALCVSAIKKFDHHIKCTYLDNVLRGGYPYKLGNQSYYVFSRKHGDLERDYNRFRLLPSYFSEGEANYRDINQNRRMDLFFNPALKKKNLIYFLNFIKIDGYNPLTIKGEKLFLSRGKAISLLKEFGISLSAKKTGSSMRLLTLMQEGFYLGEFFKLLEADMPAWGRVKKKRKVSKKVA